MFHREQNLKIFLKNMFKIFILFNNFNQQQNYIKNDAIRNLDKQRKLKSSELSSEKQLRKTIASIKFLYRTKKKTKANRGVINSRKILTASTVMPFGRNEAFIGNDKFATSTFVNSTIKVGLRGIQISIGFLDSFSSKNSKLTVLESSIFVSLAPFVPVGAIGSLRVLRTTVFVSHEFGFFGGVYNGLLDELVSLIGSWAIIFAIDGSESRFPLEKKYYDFCLVQSTLEQLSIN
ncbi:hypothetical protein BpHYR1_030034 [Brachionus plicatilis]|uniref:Uncharacterized protein n=1 Tax=Brachionus plicatilis TaxID=10195 RepID=A0A3M7S2Z8_BRAPC|nr:hypothetical protein BpHYR1_030034 [Brachionus plicatilis]